MNAGVTLRDWTYMAVVTALLVSYVVSLLSQGLNAKAADNGAPDPLKNHIVSVCALAPSST